MAHHQFMAQFYDFRIKCVYNYFLRFYLLLFNAFLNHWFMAQFQWHHFATIWSQISILSQICHHLVLIYNETIETIQRQIAQSSDYGIL